MSRRSPLIAASLAALALAMPSTAAAGTCTDADAQPGTPAFTANAAAATLCLVNNERAAAGLSALRMGPAELQEPAGAYARDMVARQFFAHETPDGIKLLQRLAAYTTGDTWTVGENLAWGESGLGTPDAIVRAWMNSPGHRANIMNGAFKELGIGVAPGAPKAVSGPAATFVHEFGARSTSTADAPSALPDTPRSTTTTKKARASRCRKVVKKVRRSNGRIARVKKTVCAKKTRKTTSTRR